MSYVSILRVTLQPGSGPEVEAAIGPFFQARQELIRQGDVLATRLVRGESQNEYVLISVWANREAHERNEDSPEERAALGRLVAFIVAPPDEFAGEIIAEVP